MIRLKWADGRSTWGRFSLIMWEAFTPLDNGQPFGSEMEDEAPAFWMPADEDYKQMRLAMLEAREGKRSVH
jgi:hypothetical protein